MEASVHIINFALKSFNMKWNGFVSKNLAKMYNIDNKKTYKRTSVY